MAAGRATDKESFEQRMIRRNVQISQWIDSFADGIDVFLVGRRVTKEKNQTTATIENSTFFNEYQKPQNQTSFNVNLRLPNLEKYWQVKFTSYDEADEKRRAGQRYVRTQPRQRNVGATVGLFRKLGDVKVSFQPRIALKDPLDVSHSLAFESMAEYKAFQINPKLELFAKPSTGTGVFVALNFHYEFNETWSITEVNEGEYRESVNTFYGTNGVSLGQQVDDKSSLSYNVFFDSNNRPVYHLEAYTFSVAWDQILYKKVLDYEVIPFVAFTHLRNFRPSLGLTLNLNLTF